MRRAGSLLSTGLLVTALLTPANLHHVAGARELGTQATSSLLIGEDFPDPDVLKADNGYFAFATNGVRGKIPVASAPAARGPWTVLGDALASTPSWAKGTGGYWAPDVSRLPDGTFVLYFSTVSAATDKMCIGTAKSAAPGGPFTPIGDAALVCVAEDSGDIDPQTFAEADGTRYLLYKSNGSPTGSPAAIWLQKLSADGTQTSGGRTELLRADLTVENSIVEAPSLVKQPSGYVLFYAADNFVNSSYHTSYAVSPTIAGAYVKAEGQFLSTPGFNGAVDGPGGADAVEGDIFFHGWLEKEKQTRGLSVSPLRFADTKPELG